MGRLLTALRAHYPVRLYQWLAVLTSIVILVFTAIIGFVRYLDQRDAEAARADAAAVYVAERASYENARDERARCELSVATRADLRGVFVSIFDAIEEGAEGSPVIRRMRETLDENYPPRSVDECPAQAIPPTPPPD